MALDHEFPTLEYLYDVAPAEYGSDTSRLASGVTTTLSHIGRHALPRVGSSIRLLPSKKVDQIALIDAAARNTRGILPRGKANAAYMPIMTRVIGASAYLEATLKSSAIEFFNRLIFSLRPLMQFWNTAENPRFSRTTLTFRKDVVVMVMRAHDRTFSVQVGCRHLDRQLESATQIFGAVRTLFSTVEVLALEYTRDCISSEWHNEADRGQWRELL